MAKDTNTRPSFEESFKLFDVLHNVIDTLEVVFRITLEVLEDFVYKVRLLYYHHNCHYNIRLHHHRRHLHEFCDH
jgi:hypothetical protein